MEIKQLRTFLAVANAKSFLAAANELYISRQAVSKTITQLEDELGHSLFVRSQNGAMMTPAGIYFYPRAASLVAEFDKLWQEMQEMDYAYRPKLRLCMALGIYPLFARQLAEYARKHRSELELLYRGCMDVDCPAMLADRRADAVLTFSSGSSTELDETLLLESPIRLLVHRGNRRTAPFFQQPLLLYTGGWDHCLFWPDPPRPEDQACSDLDYLFSLLREDAGVLPLPEALIPPHMDYARVLVPERRVEPCRIYYTLLASSNYNAVSNDLLSSIYKDVLCTVASERL